MLNKADDLWTWLIEGCVIDIKMSIAGLHLENEVPTDSKVTALIWNVVCNCIRDGLNGQNLLLPLYSKPEADSTNQRDHPFHHQAFVLAILVSAYRKGETLNTTRIINLTLRAFDAVIAEMGVMRTLATEKSAFRARYIDS
ncbi:MAG: hypothetical protein JNJ45_12775 [Chthonomonas sp.]|nr:hypothetical protein [Chthonomonas sp.]